MPPNTEGRLAKADVERLYAFNDAIEALYDPDFAAGQHASAGTTRGEAFAPENALDGDFDTYWAAGEGRTSDTLEVRLDEPAHFNVVRLQEPIDMGQRVAAYRVEVWQDDAWHTLNKGITVGYRKLDRFVPVTARRVRLVIEDARASPLINAFGLHFDAHTPATAQSGTSDTGEVSRTVIPLDLQPRGEVAAA